MTGWRRARQVGSRDSRDAAGSGHGIEPALKCALMGGLSDQSSHFRQVVSVIELQVNFPFIIIELSF